MIYRTCSKCGANLDPGERCDCEEEQRKTESYFSRCLTVEKTKQLSFDFDNEKQVDSGGIL